MKLYIPACGDRIVLAKPWTFTLYYESRNTEFAKQRKLFSENMYGKYGKPIAQVTLEEGTTLEVDRIYVRAFNKSAANDETDYDSITFRVVGVKKQRFWAKLKDCNEIEFKHLEVESFKERKLREDAEEAAKPKLLNADIIRNNISYASNGSGPYVVFMDKFKKQLLERFEECKKIHREEYDKYAAEQKRLRLHVNELQRSGFNFCNIYFSINSYKELTFEILFENISKLASDYCNFSKKADGTNVRKFNWAYHDRARYWGCDNVHYALQGMHVNVVTNADDTQIVDFYLGEGRAERSEKTRRNVKQTHGS